MTLGSGTWVQGSCPACGRPALTLANSAIRCARPGCPAPDAAARLLQEPFITDHVVEIDEDGWTVKHPMVERLDDGLFACGATTLLQEVEGGMPPSGRYLLHIIDDDLRFSPETAPG